MRSILLLSLDNADPGVVAALRDPLAEHFRASVEIQTVPLGLKTFCDEGRGQYNSTAILRHLSHVAAAHPVLDANPLGKVLAVVAQDLFVPVLTFVFGEAELGGRFAVVSYHRLQSERYGLAPDPTALAIRLEKEAVHELGHTFGLVHCGDQDCVMHSSTDVEDIDLKGRVFCRECALELEHGPYLRK